MIKVIYKMQSEYLLYYRKASRDVFQYSIYMITNLILGLFTTGLNNWLEPGDGRSDPFGFLLAQDIPDALWFCDSVLRAGWGCEGGWLWGGAAAAALCWKQAALCFSPDRNPQLLQACVCCGAQRLRQGPLWCMGLVQIQGCWSAESFE